MPPILSPIQQTEGRAQNEAIGGVLWNWTKQDPVAASTWLQNQSAGPARDSAIGGLALATFDNDPAGAVTWAAQLTDEQSRAHALTLGLTEWLKRDPSAASAWAQAHQGVFILNRANGEIQPLARWRSASLSLGY